MKKSLIALAVAGLGFSALSGTANAADGTVQFNGNIIDATCAIDASTKNLIVTLGDVNKTAFSGAGSTASATKFTIIVKDCPASITTAKVKFDGDNYNGDNNILQLTQVSGVATGVGIQIKDNSNVIVPLATASSAYTLLPGTGVTNDLDFTARYIQADSTAVAPGSANALSSFTINYN